MKYFVKHKQELRPREISSVEVITEDLESIPLDAKIELLAQIMDCDLMKAEIYELRENKLSIQD